MTLLFTVIVILGTIVDMKPLQAKSSSMTIATVNSSSRPKNAREKALVRRALLMSKRKAALEKKAALETKTTVETQTVQEAPPRPGARFLRTKTAVPDAAELTSVRPTVTLEKAGCGDTLLILPETCDDGNKVGGDGCSATCTRETGFDCNPYTHPTVCIERCGNGAVSPREKCDDGNADDNDGCSRFCTLESGYSCTTASPNVCTEVCGNGLRTVNEGCDDGNTASGDGCSSTCISE